MEHTSTVNFGCLVEIMAMVTVAHMRRRLESNSRILVHSHLSGVRRLLVHGSLVRHAERQVHLVCRNRRVVVVVSL